MQYFKAFTFAIKKPKSRWKNILFGVVCLLIPIIGPIVWLGYRSYTASDLDEDPDLEYHRDFDFNKFGDYLGKGIWQFLVQILLTCFVSIAYFGMFFGMMTVGPKNPEMMLVVLGAGYLAVFMMALLGTFFVWPLELYVALSEQVSIPRGFAFAGGFARLMWAEMLLAVIVYFLLGGLTFVLGMLACCVGMYPAMIVMSMAELHIIVQLYRSYLEKGGTPMRDLDAIHDLADED
jgi:hypothetical protein